MALCPYCGTENREGAGFCVSCRRTIGPGEWLRPRTAPAPPAGAEPWDIQYYDRSPHQPPMYTFAAFWPRAGAWVLDLLFVALLAVIPAMLLGFGLGYAVSSSQDEATTIFEEDEQDDNVALAAAGGAILAYTAVYATYFTIANGRGGGWGKRILGLRILRQRDGVSPGYGTGFLRMLIPAVFWSFISLLWLLDNLWCIWDSQKQCWHDKIAGTIVVVAR